MIIEVPSALADSAIAIAREAGENDLIFVGRVTGTQMTATFKALDFQPSLQLTVYAARPGATRRR